MMDLHFLISDQQRIWPSKRQKDLPEGGGHPESIPGGVGGISVRLMNWTSLDWIREGPPSLSDRRSERGFGPQRANIMRKDFHRREGARASGSNGRGLAFALSDQ